MASEGEHEGEEAARRLAEDILARLADGEAVDIAAGVARLPDEATRRRCLELIEAAQEVRDVLPRPLRAGIVLGTRFRLVRELGQGGMGRVFEAEDLQLERRVAVKVLTALGREHFDPERQFLNEARVLASLQHPNIVAAHELGTYGEHSFLVMDLVDGTPLGEVLDRARQSLQEQGLPAPREGALLVAAIGRPLPPGRRTPTAGDDWFRACGRVALELARTLAAAHARGIVHRDIKPQNVLLRGDATPVILDFGLAGTLDRGQGGLTQGLFGTVAYLAPEQVKRGNIGIDPRCDVYQLGLLLYEMLTLRRAYPGDEISALLARIERGEFLRPRAVDRGVPADLEAICLRAMELDSARRYATVDALREDLQRWVEEHVPPRAARGGVVAATLRNARYFVRRHRAVVSVLLAVGVIALLGLLLWPEQPWSGDLLAGRLNAESGQFDNYPDFTNVQPGDKLGFSVRGEQPVYVYAISVFGRDGPREWVTPLVPETLDEEQRPTADPWGLRVEPGTRVICTLITPGTPAGQQEGLVVFTSLKPNKVLAAWMDRLHELEDPSDHRVAYAAACAAVDAPPSTRGGRTILTEPERSVLKLAELSPDALLGPGDWELADPRRWLQYFTVETR